MSKLFDALTRAQGEVADIAFSVIDNAGTAVAVESPDTQQKGDARRNGDSLQNGDLLPTAPVMLATENIATQIPVADTPGYGTSSIVDSTLEQAKTADTRSDIRLCTLKPRNGAAVILSTRIDAAALEQYRIIRTRIVQHERTPRFIAVSSAASGDGKTISAINIAGIFALRSGATTVLVDADLRRRDVAATLNLPAEPGLSDILRGECRLQDALVDVDSIRNLYILPAGTKCTHPAELLDSPRWRQLSSALREQFDYTIVDTAPVGSVADYDLVQAVTDGVVVVVRPDHTDGTMCKKAFEMINPDKVIGVILNCAKDWILWRTHQSYSGRYYGRESR